MEVIPNALQLKFLGRPIVPLSTVPFLAVAKDEVYQHLLG